MTKNKEQLRSLDITTIAKLVRADIAAAVKSGKLPAFKCSVKTKRYSGGQSLTVEVTAVPSGYEIANGEHVLSRKGRRYTEKALADLCTLQAITDAYNWDDSDMMSDHVDVNFFTHIRFECGLEENARAIVEMAAGVA